MTKLEMINHAKDAGLITECQKEAAIMLYDSDPEHFYITIGSYNPITIMSVRKPEMFDHRVEIEFGIKLIGKIP